jgi:hypothetical protein
VPDVPLAWIDMAVVALEGDYEASKRKQAEHAPGGTQEMIARIHGGR